MARSLIQTKIASNVSSPYSGHNNNAFTDGFTADGGTFDQDSGTNEDFANLIEAVQGRGKANTAPNVPFGGYVFDGIHQEMRAFRAGSAWNNVADDGWWYWSNSYDTNPAYGGMWYYLDSYYAPYGNTDEFKSKIGFNSENYATLPNGQKAGGITLTSRFDNFNQAYTNNYNNTTGACAAARVGNTYKVSFYAMVNRLDSRDLVENSGNGASSVNYRSGNGIANQTSAQLATQFGQTHTAIAIGGELEVWAFVCDNNGNAFNTGTSTNSYLYATNGSHTNIGTNEGIRMKVNSKVSENGNAALHSADTDLSSTEWRYFEYTFTINQDNSATSGANKPRFISTRIDQNLDGSSLNIFGFNLYYYPTVSVANWSIEPINISMKRRLSGTYSSAGNTFYNREADNTDAEDSTGEVKLNASGILYDGVTGYQ